MVNNIFSIYKDLEKSFLIKPEHTQAFLDNGGFLITPLTKLSEKELFTQLSLNKILLEEKDLRLACRNHKSALEYLESLLFKDAITFEKDQTKDYVHLCLTFLWIKINPDHPPLELFDIKLYAGYEALEEEELLKCVDFWFEGYKLLIYSIESLNIHSLDILKEQLEGEYILLEWFQEYFGVLIQLSSAEATQQLQTICEEFLRQFEIENDRLIPLFRLNLARSFFLEGKKQKCDVLFSKWLEDEPKWLDGWIAWSDNHWINAGENKNYKLAESLLKRGLSRVSKGDQLDLLERLKMLYQLTKDEEKFNEVFLQIGILKDKKKKKEKTTEQDLFSKFMPLGENNGNTDV